MYATKRLLTCPQVAKVQQKLSSSISDALKKLDKIKKSPPKINENDSSTSRFGYDLVLTRSGNIIRNVTENQITKLLQVYPNGRLLDKLGNVRILRM